MECGGEDSSLEIEVFCEGGIGRASVCAVHQYQFFETAVTVILSATVILSDAKNPFRIPEFRNDAAEGLPGGGSDAEDAEGLQAEGGGVADEGLLFGGGENQREGASGGEMLCCEGADLAV